MITEVRKSGPWWLWWVLANSPGQATRIIAAGKAHTEDLAHRRARGALAAARIKEELPMDDTKSPYLAIADIPWRHFQSAHKSHVLQGAYDADNRHLYIQFQDVKTGALRDVYVYEDVDPETWTALCQAESKGSFLNGTIAKLFPYQKLSGPAQEVA